MSNKPVVLFVHGSWHTPKHFEIVRAIFEKAGYETSCPRQPSVGNLPPVCLVDDAKRITHELEQLVEEKQKDVLVVAHSYGGMVANLGVEKRFAKAVCTEQGKAGGVVRIIYMAAFLVPIGQSLSSPLGGTLPPFIPVDEQEMCIMLDPQMRFYHDLPTKEQDHWASELLKSPASTQYAPLTDAAYTSHPVSYIVCTVDKALPEAAQRAMIENISQEYGVTITTEALQSSHSPFLSMPDKLLLTVEKLAA